MRKLFIYILLVGINLSASANKVDSLTTLLKTAKEENKANIYNELAIELVGINVDTAIYYAEKALEVAEEYNNQKEIMYAYDGLGTAYAFLGKFKDAEENNLKSLELANSLGEKKQQAYVYNKLGVIYKQQGNTQKALEYYQKSLSIYEELKIPKQIGMAICNIGNIYYYYGIDYDKALEYYNKGLENFEKAGSKNNVAIVLNTMALVYKEKKNYPKAEEYFHKSEKLFNELQVPSGLALVKKGLGNINLEEKKYDKALKYNLEALTIYKSIGDQLSYVGVLMKLGEVYAGLNNTSKALSYYKEALTITKKLNFKREAMDANRNIAELYALQTDFRNAYNYLKNYSTLKDSILSDDYLKQIQDLSVKYETDKKDKEIQLQKETNKRQKFVIIGVAFIAFVVLMFLVFIYKLFRDKKKANILLAEQNDEIKKQRDQIFQQKKEITDSIHYASRIQRAVLPSHKIIEDYGLQHFILFKPRDIVSGDFYWMNHKENKLIVAAADCTGHGVPGAFMSMLGMALLNEIVAKTEVITAAEILNQLRLQVIKSLHQSGKQEETKDGMDISLCVIDRDNNRIDFAGAFNPMYLVRNGEIIETGADRMPVGFHDKIDVPFTNHEITFMKGDTIYIFSDGYVDQFGGDNGKKFMAKRFKTLLLGMNEQPMEKQRDILDQTILEWRGDLDQIDDVMVLGVKF